MYAGGHESSAPGVETIRPKANRRGTRGGSRLSLALPVMAGFLSVLIDCEVQLLLHLCPSGERGVASGKGLRGEPKRNAVFVAPKPWRRRTKPRLSFWAEAPWSARGLVP